MRRKRGRPLVSVVVPAWNAEKTLGETLQSVAGQTCRDIEILIVDDGSTDRTAEIAMAFCAAEPRARLIRKGNGGVASARNRGIEEAKGEWVAPIDSDDLWHPTRVQKMVEAALAAPARPGFVYCWSRHIDARGEVTASSARWALSGHAFAQLACINVVGNGSGLLLCRQSVLDVGGYDPRLRAEDAQGAEDLLLQIRMGARYPVVTVPEHLVGWRISAGSMSGDAEQMDRSCRLVYRRLAEDGTPAPGLARRSLLAASAFDMTEHHAAAGRFGRAAAWAAQAMVLDPVRSGLMLAYRLARSARRRFGRKRPPAARTHFYEVDPKAGMATDPYRLPALLHLIERVEARRLRALATTGRQSLAVTVRTDADANI